MPETGSLTHAPELADGMHHHRPVILVVDDERGVHEFCHALLGDQYDLLGAHDGPTALATLDSHNVDLVLLDLRLPGIDGLEVLAQINETRPQLKVIVLTAVMSVRTASGGDEEWRLSLSHQTVQWRGTMPPDQGSPT
jgi:CheY-like chemotaxis protein